MKVLSSGRAGSRSSQVDTRPELLHLSSVSLCAGPFHSYGLIFSHLEPRRKKDLSNNFDKAQKTLLFGLPSQPQMQHFCPTTEHIDWHGSSLKSGGSHRRIWHPNRQISEKKCIEGQCEWLSGCLLLSIAAWVRSLGPTWCWGSEKDWLLRVALWPPHVHVCGCTYTHTHTKCKFLKI